MKLRQKLAMVLAAAMVVTAVPVTTMAASTNKFNKTLSLVEGTQVTTKSGLELQMEFDESPVNEVFYLDASDFEFNANEYKLKADTTGALENAIVDAQNDVNAAQKILDDLKADKEATEEAIKNAQDNLDTAKKALDAAKKALDKEEADNLEIGDVEISVLSEKQLKVVVKGHKNNKIAVPVYGKAKKGTPAIVVDGSDSLATSGKYTIAGGEIVTDKALAATVDGDPVNISVDGKGELGNIKIEEAVAGSLSGQTITIELDNKSDLKFANSNKGDFGTAKSFKLEGLRGLASTSFDEEDVKVVLEDDNETLKVTFPTTTNKTRGAVVLKGIDVEPQDAKEGADTGKVEVTVKGSKIADTDLHVANVTDFGLELKAKEAVELTAGKGTKKVKVQFNELAAGSINENRDVFFKFEGATVKEFATKRFEDDNKNLIATLTYDVKDEEFQLKFEEGFKDEVINKFEFEVEIYADVDYTGDVKVIASSRDFDDMEAVVGSVVASTTAATKEAVVKVGLNGQVAGEVTITEEKAETFAKGKEIIVKLDADAQADGIKIRDAKVEVTEGDVVIDEDSIEIKNGEIRFTIKRESDEASTIKISEIELDVNRLTPEGSYGIVIGGAAISDRNETTNKEDKDNKDERNADVIEVEKFVVVGTKNTEDLPNAAAAKEIVLTVGSTAYTVNGEAKTADAAAFIDASNRTMVPVRFVAEEFGKVDFGTINGVGTVTIFKDGAVLQFQNGSNIMNKNGINVPMDTQVVIKDGRTYVPFKYVADGLGIGYTYDAATKSITFTNQAK